MNFIKYKQNQIPEERNGINIKLGGEERSIKKQNYNCLNIISAVLHHEFALFFRKKTSTWKSYGRSQRNTILIQIHGNFSVG
jgi:hypothetical protein